MSLSFEQLRVLKKKKEKYYTDAIERGDPPLYGMGKDYRLKNTEEDRGKRRYGFNRKSVRQRHRIKKTNLVRRNPVAKRNFETILQPKEVNNFYDIYDMDECYSYIYSCYHNYKKLSDGAHSNEIYLTRVRHLIGNGSDKEIFLSENYLEIFHEAFIKFMESIENYNKTNGPSFYTYVINVLPYILSTKFNKAWKLNSDALKTVELEDDIEDLYTPINSLGVLIRINNMSNTDKRKFIYGTSI